MGIGQVSLQALPPTFLGERILSATEADPPSMPLCDQAPVTFSLTSFPCPHSPSSSHTCLLTIPPTHQTPSDLRVFARAVASARTALPQDMAHALSSLLLKCHSQREPP